MIHFIIEGVLVGIIILLVMLLRAVAGQCNCACMDCGYADHDTSNDE